MEFNAWIMDISQFLTRYSAMFFGGLRNTLILSAIAGVLSVLVGGGLCVLRMSRLAPLRWIANVWIEFVRGTPVLVQIMMVYYGLPLLGVNLPAPSFLGTAGSRSMYGILALTINFRHPVGRSRPDGGGPVDRIWQSTVDAENRHAAGGQKYFAKLRQ